LSTVSKILFRRIDRVRTHRRTTQASAVDLALPGVLPVAEQGAVERAIRFGLRSAAPINKRSVFAR
jgi:aspartyl-tRNA(Asn)/glutamyl-tRNA(Gln) amidotransferase subunit B